MKCVCHNCRNENPICDNSTITYFVSRVFPHLYDSFKDQIIDSDDSYSSVKFKKSVDVVEERNVGVPNFDGLDKPVEIEYPIELVRGVYRFDKVLAHNQNHPIVKYIVDRKIPDSAFERLYVTNTFKESFQQMSPKNVEKLYPNTMALILPMYTEEFKLYGVQARFLSDKFRFLTLKFDEEIMKMFGYERFDKNKLGFVVEAPIDSLHIRNCIASMDSALTKVSDYINMQNTIFVYDNQPRNKSVVSGMKNCIENGNKIVIFDSYMEKYKDINDMARYGNMSMDDIEKYLMENIYQSEYAIDKLYEWAKIKA